VPSQREFDDHCCT